MRSVCRICGLETDCDRHHILGGSLRKKSEKYKQYCVIRVCRTCHNKIHAHPAEYIYLKREAQQRLMDGLEWTIEDWHREFGKSYL